MVESLLHAAGDGLLPFDLRDLSSLPKSAIIYAGTSRFLTFHAADIFSRGSIDDIASAFRSDSLAGTSATTHYQDAKVLLVERGASCSSFSFRFYQWDSVNQKLLPDLECANGSAAAAHFAIINDLVRFRPDLTIQGYHEGTRQAICLSMHGADFTACKANWSVQFEYPEPISVRLLAGLPTFSIAVGTQVITYRLLPKGNLFLFINASQKNIAPSDLIAIVADARARVSAIMPNVATVTPKVIFYAPSASRDHLTFDVACNYKGEWHRSFPGSAAMTLATLLAADQLPLSAYDATKGVIQVKFKTPNSTSIVTSVNWVNSAGSVTITSAGFSTRVSLAFIGRHAIPGSSTHIVSSSKSA
jgi:hypothetical protein